MTGHLILLWLWLACVGVAHFGGAFKDFGKVRTWTVLAWIGFFFLILGFA